MKNKLLSLLLLTSAALLKVSAQTYYFYDYIPVYFDPILGGVYADGIHAPGGTTPVSGAAIGVLVTEK